MKVDACCYNKSIYIEGLSLYWEGLRTIKIETAKNINIHFK